MKFNLFSILLELFCIFLTVIALKDPSEKIENGVYVVDIDNYDSIVLNKSKDVFVMFYSPSCPFSKKLLPTFESLSKRYNEKTNDIVFAKFDGTEVDVPETSPWIELEEFPTMVLFTKTDIDKKNYYVYPLNDSRTLAKLAAFLKKNSSNHNEIEVTAEEEAEVDNYDDIDIDEIDDDQELTEEQIKELLSDDRFDIGMEDDDEEVKNYPPLREDPKFVRLGGEENDIVNEKEEEEKQKNETTTTSTETMKAKATTESKKDDSGIPKTAEPKDEL